MSLHNTVSQNITECFRTVWTDTHSLQSSVAVVVIDRRLYLTLDSFKTLQPLVSDEIRNVSSIVFTANSLALLTVKGVIYTLPRNASGFIPYRGKC